MQRQEWSRFIYRSGRKVSTTLRSEKSSLFRTVNFVQKKKRIVVQRVVRLTNQINLIQSFVSFIILGKWFSKFTTIYNEANWIVVSILNQTITSVWNIECANTFVHPCDRSVFQFDINRESFFWLTVELPNWSTFLFLEILQTQNTALLEIFQWFFVIMCHKVFHFLLLWFLPSTRNSSVCKHNVNHHFDKSRLLVVNDCWPLGTSSGMSPLIF